MNQNKLDPEHLIARDINSYLEIIFQLSKKNSGARCYRGQSNIAWKLKPSVMRDLRSGAENQILSELLVEAPNEFGSDKSMFDKLVRAQHYSLPTRLLDVTLNPLVALYFACEGNENRKNSGQVQIFDFTKTRVKFADSDTISIICNLSRLSDLERTKIKEEYNKHKKQTPWTDKELNTFRNTEEIQRLMQFVKAEKSYFLDKVKPVDLFRYFFVYPSKNNKRVIAQSGAFIAAGLLEYNAPENSAGIKLKTITIPAESKIDVIKQLDTLNINSRTMFPEIESTSNYIKKKWSL
ncbi:FRG domain-containing protein [Pseudomonas sp. dw_612]|uniref:FRG domain-containing protein n=1 Tax=Pseudomonas sp. dw_612 TaxID=2720080 RepID=UPI001BD5B974|nr:FRG domain-containing protein [Pseudomonas sp. dw_612]